MKKIAAAVFAAVSMITAASALDLSAGALFDYNFVHKFVEKDKVKASFDWSEIGFKAFFDAQYAQVQLGLNTHAGDTTVKVNNEEPSPKKIEASYFNIGVLGKYPIAAGPAKIYPMLGFDFDITTSAKSEGISLDKNKEKLNAYWFDAGVGADIFVTNNFYIKPQVLFGLKMNAEKHEFLKENIHGIKINAGIGAGWKF